MKKEDLKNGSVVETRNGNRYLVVDNTLLNLSFDSLGYFLSLKDYRDDLTFKGDFDIVFDIVKVHNEPLNDIQETPTCNMSLIEAVKRGKWTWIRKELPNLTCDEKTILRNLPKDYNFIARDLDGRLFIYNSRPYKENIAWNNDNNFKSINGFDHLFSFIKWEDEEPYLISDLLGE